jgi:hypothetical protein
MKKSEMIQMLIEIEESDVKNIGTTITMNYIEWLKIQKRLIEIGDVEIK